MVGLDATLGLPIWALLLVDTGLLALLVVGMVRLAVLGSRYAITRGEWRCGCNGARAWAMTV